MRRLYTVSQPFGNRFLDLLGITLVRLMRNPQHPDAILIEHPITETIPFLGILTHVRRTIHLNDKRIATLLIATSEPAMREVRDVPEQYLLLLELLRNLHLQQDQLHKLLMRSGQRPHVRGHDLLATIRRDHTILHFARQRERRYISTAMLTHTRSSHAARHSATTLNSRQ